MFYNKYKGHKYVIVLSFYRKRINNTITLNKAQQISVYFSTATRYKFKKTINYFTKSTCFKIKK